MSQRRAGTGNAGPLGRQSRTAGRQPVSAPRRAGRPGHDPDSVLAVAVAVFNERGYDGTSMEDLARALGVTKSAIYHHVAGKDELLLRSLSLALDGLFALTEEPGARQGRAIERLHYVLRGSVLVLAARLPHVTLLLRVRGNTPVEADALRRRREFDAFVEKLVTEAVSDGDLRPDLDPGMTTRLLFGMVNSITEWYRPASAGTPKALADAVATIAFDGLTRRC